jgi:hypothetical protein
MRLDLFHVCLPFASLCTDGIQVGIFLLLVRMVLAVGYLSLNWCRVDIPAVGLGAAWDYAHATYLAIVHQHVRFQLADDYAQLDVAAALGADVNEDEHEHEGRDSTGKQEPLLSDDRSGGGGGDALVLAAVAFSHH